MKRLVDIAWIAASSAVTAALVGLWQIVANLRLVNPVFLPGPDKAWNALIDGFASGQLGSDLLTTTQRMLIGWVLASLVGIALGALIGSSRAAREYLNPLLEFMRPLPASAIVPIAITFFGLTNGMILGVIAFGSLWPMLLATVNGFATVEPRLIEVGRSLRFTRLETVRKIILPSTLPEILAAMRLGLTIALILAVVGEILAGQEGLGYRILLAARRFHTPDLFAGVMLLGLIGLVSNVVLRIVEGYALAWKRAG